MLATCSPLLATMAAYVLGTMLVLPTAALTAPLVPVPRLSSLAAWAVVFYQGIFGAVAHIWWYEAVRVVGPSQAARIGVWHVVGTLFILAGVGLTTRVYTPKPDSDAGPADAASRAS